MNFLIFYLISVVVYWLLEVFDRHGHEGKEDDNENMAAAVFIIMFIPFVNTLAIIGNIIVTVYDLLTVKFSRFKWGKIYDKMFFKRKYTDKV